MQTLLENFDQNQIPHKYKGEMLDEDKLFEKLKLEKEIIEKAKPELKRLDKVCDALEKLKNGYLTPEQTQEFIEGRKKLNLFGKEKQNEQTR